MLKRVQTPVLEIAHHEHGLADGWPVVLPHGFPYDLDAYDEVAPLLAAHGARVLVPDLRGFGPTRFLAPATHAGYDLGDRAARRASRATAPSWDSPDFIDVVMHAYRFVFGRRRRRPGPGGARAGTSEQTDDRRPVRHAGRGARPVEARGHGVARGHVCGTARAKRGGRRARVSRPRLPRAFADAILTVRSRLQE